MCKLVAPGSASHRLKGRAGTGATSLHISLLIYRTEVTVSKVFRIVPKTQETVNTGWPLLVFQAKVVYSMRSFKHKILLSSLD